MEFLKIENLSKLYTSRFGSQQTQALNGLSFSVEEGDFVAVMGESGSGKTTLLNILAALDKPTGGSVLLNGTDLAALNDHEITSFRRKNLGFVFQDFNLLDTMTVKDNIFLPLVLSKASYSFMDRELKTLAPSLGIDQILEKYPYEISGGQKQRAAVARALITQPKLILADEPTGSLDSRSSEQLLQTFRRINREGQSILMVTHSTRAASFADRVLFIKDGTIFHQLYKGNQSDDQMFQTISDSLKMLASGGDR